HACIGLHLWLRLSALYRRVTPLLLAMAVLLQALSVAGFAVAGRDALSKYGHNPRPADILNTGNRPDAAGEATLQRWTVVALSAVGVPLAGLAMIFLLRGSRIGRRRVEITYAGGPTVHGPVGATLLEISRMRRVPHASICGGRAR